MKIPRVMIAAAASGSGKTAAACALMEALKQTGSRVAACKCGPDYIDPMFHREVVGVESENLDLFFLEPERLRAVFARHAKDSDIAVVEGVMGYYDGLALETEKGSSCEIAEVLELPVILVLPCRGMARSVLAVLKGLLEFRPQTRIRGILLNRVSASLYPRMKTMIEDGLLGMGHPVPVVGYLPEAEEFRMESRHLGLVTPGEQQGWKDRMWRAGERLRETVDLSRIRNIAEGAPELPAAPFPPSLGGSAPAKGSRSVRVAVARDAAFCFYYRSSLELLERLGCELVPFRPLRDPRLPEQIGGLLLGGGYPELYAAELSDNRGLLAEIRERIRGGMPCLAECGGFLYLHRQLEGADGVRYPMAGVIDSSAARGERLARFGYLTLVADRDGAYLAKGEKIRGHEFHYWDSTDSGSSCTAVKPAGGNAWKCVHMEGNLFAGYPHLYLESNPVFAERFAEACRREDAK